MAQNPNSTHVPVYIYFLSTTTFIYIHFIFGYLHSTTSWVVGTETVWPTKLKLFTPVVEHEWIWQKRFTLFAALRFWSFWCPGSINFLNKFIFIQSSKISPSHREVEGEGYHSLEKCGWVWSRFCRIVEGTLSQVRNPHDCKHINIKSGSERQWGTWPKRKSLSMGNQTESVSRECNQGWGKPCREIHLLWEAVGSAAVFLRRRMNDESKILGWQP